jgi:hypothetical protein
MVERRLVGWARLPGGLSRLEVGEFGLEPRACWVVTVDTDAAFLPIRSLSRLRS